MNIDWTKVDAVAGGLTKSELFNETLFSLGGQYSYDGMVIPSPTAGNLMLLEILGNGYITGEMEDYDIDEALFILVMGKDAVGAVMDDRMFDSPIKDRVEKFIKGIVKYRREIIKVYLNAYFKYSMHGFDMLPKSDGIKENTMTFDTDWLAGYVKICRSVTGREIDYITWEMPVIIGGFCLANNARENGMKNVERPQDWQAQLAELKRQIEETK